MVRPPTSEPPPLGDSRLSYPQCTDSQRELNHLGQHFVGFRLCGTAPKGSAAPRVPDHAVAVMPARLATIVGAIAAPIAPVAVIVALLARIGIGVRIAVAVARI